MRQEEVELGIITQDDVIFRELMPVGGVSIDRLTPYVEYTLHARRPGSGLNWDDVNLQTRQTACHAAF